VQIDKRIEDYSTVFAGFAYNYHKYFGLDAERALHTLSFRLGFNFGKANRETQNGQHVSGNAGQ